MQSQQTKTGIEKDKSATHSGVADLVLQYPKQKMITLAALAEIDLTIKINFET